MPKIEKLLEPINHPYSVDGNTSRWRKRYMSEVFIYYYLALLKMLLRMTIYKGD